MVTASHAAGLELRHTVWAMQVLPLGTGLEGFERYRLFANCPPVSNQVYAEDSLVRWYCRHSCGRRLLLSVLVPANKTCGIAGTQRIRPVQLQGRPSYVSGVKKAIRKQPEGDAGLCAFVLRV